MARKKVKGYIRRLGPNRYNVEYFIGRDPETGKKRMHNKLIHGTKTDAEEYLSKLELVKTQPGKLVTVGSYLDRWLESTVKLRVRERTAGDYEEYLRLYIRPTLGKLLLEQLQPATIQRAYDQLQLTGSTKRKLHNIFRSALDQAVLDGLMPYNPAAHPTIKVPRARKPGASIKPFDSNQARSFIKAAVEVPRGIICIFAVVSGMRPEEYLALQWPDIDWERGRVEIRRVIIWRRKGAGWYFEDVKTENSRREIDLPAPVLELLGKHRELQDIERKARGDKYAPHQLVFATEDGGPINPANLNNRVFKVILEKAKLADRRQYDLRHSMATVLLELGEDIKTISERMGHGSAGFTLDTYTKVTRRMQARSSGKLATLFGEQRTDKRESDGPEETPEKGQDKPGGARPS